MMFEKCNESKWYKIKKCRDRYLDTLFQMRLWIV